MLDYPAPAHAAYIWTAGDTLWLGFPPSQGHTRGHAIHFPGTPEGLKWAMKVLREREQEGSLKIGQRGCPASAQVKLTTVVREIVTPEARALEREERRAESRRRQAGIAEIDLEALGL